MSVDADPLALIIAGGSAAITSLLGLVVALISHRASNAEKRIEALEKQHTAFWVKSTETDGRVRTSEAEIAALKKDALTRELFEERTSEQDRKLDRLDGKVERVGRDLVNRPTRSEMSIPASRVPVRREDPSDPAPPMRPRASSVRRGDT